jgi:hypothetical protein
MELSDQLHDLASLHPGKSPWYPLDGRQDEPQNQSGSCGEEKNALPLLEIEPWPLSPYTVTIRTELYRIPYKIIKNI